MIEHLHKKEALELLNNFDNWFNEQIIFTQNGFLKQDRETHLEYDNNPYQWHKCGFTIEEFQN
ncbi:MAG: hypothetical protein ACYC49_02405 [Ignavibacteriaceae bacterium]